MIKNTVKAKKGPWIPPPGRSKRDSNKSKKSEYIQESEFNKPDEEILEVMSLCSCASIDENQGDFHVILHNVKQEHRVLNLYFMSLRPISQFLNRFMSKAGVEDEAVKKLLNKAEEQLNYLFSCFEDLEFNLTFLKNKGLSGSDHSEGLMKLIKLKEKLLLKLLECYTDILTVFQIVLEEQGMIDTTKQEKERDTFRTHFVAQEKKFLTQAATIKDLERRLSVLQSKYSAVEGYNTTLEETKDELQRALQHKDIQIKKLSSDINRFSVKQDDERLIELIEEIKRKAQSKKKALKKALKAQKMQIEQNKESLKKLEDDNKEKVKMLFELAAQRDKLKVQLTVANNEAIQMKYNMEEIKSQKLKVQNEFDECETNFKKKLQESSEIMKKQLDKAIEEKLKLEKTVRKLEDNISTTAKELEIAKSSQNTLKQTLVQVQNECSGEKTLEEVKNLIFLLKDTKEYLKNISNPDPGAAGDSLHILKQLEELKHMHKSVLEENASLKLKIEEMKNMTISEQAITLQNPGAINAESNFSAGNLQMELIFKNDEILRYKQRVIKLESQLEEVKEELQRKELQNCRLSSLEEALKRNEEELKHKKNELSFLEQKKEEESERLLRRSKELQEALDEMTSNYESLQRYVDMLKTSLYNVFGNS